MNSIISSGFLISLLLLLSSCSDASDTYDSNVEFPIVGINIHPTETEVSTKEGSFEIVLESDSEWKAEELSSWLFASVKTGDKGKSTVTIKFRDAVTESRIGLVRFVNTKGKAVSLQVQQEGNPDAKVFTNHLAGIPDPWLIEHEGNYYTCKAADGVNISRSDKMTAVNPSVSIWKTPKDSPTEKPWNVAHVWAPELHRINGKWYIYYTAGRPHDEKGYYQQRSGVLRAKTDDPMGEWEDMGMLYTGDNYETGIISTMDNTIWGIDLNVFELKGQLYGVWSGLPSNEDKSAQWLYIAKMENPYTISSNRIMISKPDQSWELVNSKINEGPAVLKNEKDGKLFIVYSANGSWTKHYRLGYLMLKSTDSDPMDPNSWIKSDDQIFYRNDDTTDRDGVNGVGHCCFTKSSDGKQDWIVYHAKHRNDNTYESGRGMYIKRFDWYEDGTPNFGFPAGNGELQIVPSGQE